jgi:hypothetical protein
MGIKLDVSVETPLSDDDRDILAGISVMVHAIANRQNLAEQLGRPERPARRAVAATRTAPRGTGLSVACPNTVIRSRAALRPGRRSPPGRRASCPSPRHR